MAQDLFDMYQDAIGDQLVNQASSMFGEPAQSVYSAFGIVLPTLFGTLIQKGGTEAGAKDLMNFLTTNNFEGNLLSRVGGLLSGGTQTETLLNSGSEVLKYLMGDKLALVADFISDGAKIKTSSAGNLLKLTAPLVLSIVGKHIKRNGLGPDEVNEFLLSQRTLVMKSIPPGISDLLGFANLADLKTPAETTGTEFIRPTKIEAQSQPMLNKLLPWIVLLLAALALLYFLGRGCAGAKNRTPEVMGATEKTLNDGTKTAAVADTDTQIVKKDIDNATEQDNTKVISPGVKGVAGLSQALATGAVNPNTAFILETGDFQGKSAVLTAPSEKELDQLVTVLKAYPNAQIRIEAHTDNAGNADINKQLSTQQALAVMTYLQSRGIPLNRMSTIGRGQTKPLAPNDTDAAREQNKRVEIYVVRAE